MVWHTVRISFKSVSDERREDVEKKLAELPDVVPEIAWFRIGRDAVDPDVSLIVSGFETVEKLDAYRAHPNHRPAQDALHGSGARILGMSDIETDDDPFGPIAPKGKR
jgi:Stress responsive A/B Barrel Domain